MAITRAQQYRQMLENGGRGISLQEAKDMAPKGEFLAYINKKEAKMLKDAGGSGIMTNAGIPSFIEYDGGDSGTFSQAASTGSVQGDVDRGGGGTDYGDPDPEVDVPTRNRQDTITSFTKNLGANFRSNPFSFLTPIGTGIKTALQTNQARKMLGYTSPTTPTFNNDRGDNNMEVLPLWAQLGFNSEAEYLASLAAQQETEDEGLRLAFRANGGRIGAAEGGIMDLETGRQMYFLGKLVKKATRAVKKVVKSPIGKAALLYAATGGLGNLAAGKGFFGGAMSNIFKPTTFLGNVGSIFSKGGLENIMSKARLGKFVTSGGSDLPIFEKNLLGKVLTSPTGLITAASTVAGLLTPQQEEEAQQIADNTGIDIEEARNQILKAAAGQDDFRARAFKADGGIMRLGYDEAGAVMSEKEMKKLAKSSLYKGFKTMYGVSPEMAKENEAYDKKFDMFEQLYKKGFQKGGDVEPVAKKTMPLLDMGGKEMDLREDGGFVPIGRMEKADDVPARLSKNEFVFTADAVRNAGDGNVDKGAEVMYNMMKNLESGGEVSEESQGLEGARRMFQTSQRLEEVI